jgi:RimJ/RimL family protein N-acetyltransferase
LVPVTASRIQLQTWSDADLDLLHRINAPEMTEHLGGPETAEQILTRHQRYVEIGDTGTGRMFTIVLLPGGESVGNRGYWDRLWHAEMVYETGWNVLPPFQGRGIAAAAARLCAANAKAEQRHRYLHAYPSVDNPASNAVCRKAGFEFIGEYDFEYPPGNPIRCNDWRIDLTAPM